MPSALDYIERARRNGCGIDTQTVERDGQRFHQVIITAPGGRTAVEILSEEEEDLASTTIARLDRRLGIKSHFFV